MKYRSPFDHAVDLVCTEFKIKRSELVGRCRERRFAWPRQVVAWLMREGTARSYPEIGRLLDGRDHTTIMHSCRQVDRRRANYIEYRMLTERLLHQMPRMVQAVSCGNCRFWRRISDVRGECENCMPLVGPNGQAIWPITTADRCCPAHEIKVALSPDVDDHPQLELAISA